MFCVIFSFSYRKSIVSYHALYYASNHLKFFSCIRTIFLILHVFNFLFGCFCFIYIDNYTHIHTLIQCHYLLPFFIMLFLFCVWNLSYFLFFYFCFLFFVSLLVSFLFLVSLSFSQRNWVRTIPRLSHTHIYSSKQPPPPHEHHYLSFFFFVLFLLSVFEIDHVLVSLLYAFFLLPHYYNNFSLIAFSKWEEERYYLLFLKPSPFLLIYLPFLYALLIVIFNYSFCFTF